MRREGGREIWLMLMSCLTVGDEVLFGWFLARMGEVLDRRVFLRRSCRGSLRSIGLSDTIRHDAGAVSVIGSVVSFLCCKT